MRIEIVQMENIRSHAKSTVPFARGFNCLVGGLGCGKSSILYAIDFALFGEPVGRSFDYLLREGENAGKITVQFVHNGKSYRICRGLKRRGKGISQDFDELKLFEGGELISSVKSEAVAEQLKAATGFDKDLFREVIWVRQEHLKELLDAQPRERQRRLDELLGLSDFENAWSGLAAYERDYEVERRVYEKDPDVVGMEKLGAENAQVAEELSKLEVESEDLIKKMEIAKKASEEADLKLRKLEDVRARNEELKRRETKILTNLSNIQGDLASLAEKIERKERSVSNLKQRLGGIETQITSLNGELEKIGMSPEQPIEALRGQVSNLDDQISSVKGRQQAAVKGIEADKARISSLSTESRCPLCLQKLSENYKDDLVRRIHDENDEREKAVNELQRELSTLQQLKDKAGDILSNLTMLRPRVEEVKTRLSDEIQGSAELSREREGKQEMEKKLYNELDALRTELVRFDVSELEAAKSQSREAFQRHSSLESDLVGKENSKKVLARRLNELKDRIDQGQQKIDRMQKTVRAIEIISTVREAYRSIQPKLRSEFVKVLQRSVQQILDNLMSAESSFINILIDETYTPYVMSEGGIEREVSNLSGGERTLLAFAYRLGLGQLIMQSRTGHGLNMLLLDEPTESLGTEDGSIDRLAEAISRLKAIEQTVAVTHSEAFAEKAEHVIRLEKESSESRVSVER
jgi:exonuclease SbcC